jgi:hypothetical protein
MGAELARIAKLGMMRRGQGTIASCPIWQRKISVRRHGWRICAANDDRGSRGAFGESSTFALIEEAAILSYGFHGNLLNLFPLLCFRRVNRCNSQVRSFGEECPCSRRHEMERLFRFHQATLIHQ